MDKYSITVDRGLTVNRYHIVKNYGDWDSEEELVKMCDPMLNFGSFVDIEENEAHVTIYID